MPHRLRAGQQVRSIMAFPKFTIAVIIAAFIKVSEPWPSATDSELLIRPKRVIKGRQVELGQAPFQVSLQRQYEDRLTHYCGGSLLADKWVLTAAHCIRDVKEENVVVKAGMVELGDPTAQQRHVKAFFKHPNYDKPNNDIGLILLTEAFELSTTAPLRVATVPLATSRRFKKSDCRISGWGLNEDNVISTQLMAANVPFVPHSACRDSFKKVANITNKMLCYGGGQQDSCKGDSGGPLVCGKVLVGITSFGQACASPGVPGVYTDVSKFKSWIQEVLKENSEGVPKVSDAKDEDEMPK